MDKSNTDKDKQNLSLFIHSIASLTVIASNTAASLGFEALSERLYNIACTLYDEAFDEISD